MVAGSNVSKISKRSSLFGINHFDRLINCPITSVMYFPVQSIYPDKQHFIGKHNPRKWLWCPQPQEPIILPWIIHNINLFGTLPPYTHIINAIKLVPEQHAGLGPTKKKSSLSSSEAIFHHSVGWLVAGWPACRQKWNCCLRGLTHSLALFGGSPIGNDRAVCHFISASHSTAMTQHGTAFLCSCWTYSVGEGSRNGVKWFILTP